MREFVLKNICSCSINQQLDLLRIRNLPEIRTAMYTDHEIGEIEHFAYLSRLRDDCKQTLFAVLEGDEVVGSAGISRIDGRHKSCDWAFYLSPQVRGGLGAVIEIAILDHVFFSLGMEKLNCEVLSTNPGVIRMHKRFGFQEEGVRRANIVKGSERVDVHLLGLTRSEWQAEADAARAAIGAKFPDIRLAIIAPEQPSGADRAR